MNKAAAIQEFLSSPTTYIPLGNFIVNLFLAAVIAHLISIVYVKYGRSLSNRKAFAHNFIIISLTTTLIITIVKSSLALSLGLVGALSIVRFRAAIKEPEELAYLFLCISIGLGFGANQRIITITSSLIICIIVVLMGKLKKSEDSHNLCLILSSSKPKNLELDQLIDILKKHCSDVQLRRLDENKENLEASFFVSFDDFVNFKQSRAELKELHPGINITFLDNKSAA